LNLLIELEIWEVSKTVIIHHQIKGNEGVTSVSKEGFYKSYPKFIYIATSTLQLFIKKRNLKNQLEMENHAMLTSLKCPKN